MSRTAGEPSFIAFPRLDAFGEGGFRINGVRRDGSVLIVNGDVFAWPVTAIAEAAPGAFEPVFEAAPRPELVLLGVGARMAPPPTETRERFRDAAVGLEFMDTAAACRVYATLVGEGRHVAAALIAVE